MHRYLLIVEEHSAAVIDEARLKQFLSQTKVWEYARVTEQDYKDMAATDRFALLQDYYAYMSENMGSGINCFFFLFTVSISIFASALSLSLCVFYYRTN